MSLVADYSDSSSSSSSSSDAEGSSVKQETSADAKKPLLPSATLILKNASNNATGEVFQTKYHREEQANKAKMERHVKMVEAEYLTTKNGRKICWNYRKGRCRFGTKCQYAHDSDLCTETAAEPTKVTADTQRKPISTIQQGTIEENINLDEKNFNKRKRPGLGDAITPGKRVMKAYMQNYKK